MHVLREEVNSERTGSRAGYTDDPSQAMDHQSAQLLAQGVFDVFMAHLC